MSHALDQHCAIVTGASQGLGYEIAKTYIGAGANLLICARDARVLDKAFGELRQLVPAGQSIIAIPADVSQVRDATALVDRALTEFGRLDIIVNNAGVAGPIGPLEELDWVQWQRTIEINLMGAVWLSRAALPHFKRMRRGKIIQLSGGGATQPTPMLSAYAASKAAVVRFVETLAQETRAWHIDINAIAPGALDTRMLNEILAAGPSVLGQAYYDHLLQQKRSGGAPLSKGAELALFLGSTLSDGITGRLISAIWDPWDELPGRVDELSATDIYTLRRITPEDRALKWGKRE
jgi:NAD(P)-dependent dehydrogenase (short-subunit alcohol dehydrogenase family)